MARRLTRRQLEQLAESFEPRIRDTFLAAFRDVREQALPSRLAELIAGGQGDLLADALGINAARFSELAEVVRDVFARAGAMSAQELPVLMSDPTALRGSGTFTPATRPMRVHFNFDLHAAGAEAWIREHSSTLVTRIIEDQRAALRSTVAEGMAMGRNPRQTALDIVGRTGASGRRSGGIVGLNAQQAQYVSNARAELLAGDPRYFSRARRDKRFDATIRKAMREGRPLTQAQVDRIVGRYSDRLLQLRGETIARSESHEAMNAARFESYVQAVEAGDLDPANVRKGWQTASDDRVRHSHEEMDGVEVPLMEPFITPLGSRLMFPGDTTMGAAAEDTINCRCPMRVRIDYAAEANRGQ